MLTYIHVLCLYKASVRACIYVSYLHTYMYGYIQSICACMYVCIILIHIYNMHTNIYIHTCISCACGYTNTYTYDNHMHTQDVSVGKEWHGSILSQSLPLNMYRIDKNPGEFSSFFEYGWTNPRVNATADM